MHLPFTVRHGLTLTLSGAGGCPWNLDSLTRSRRLYKFYVRQVAGRSGLCSCTLFTVHNVYYGDVCGEIGCSFVRAELI